MTVASSEITLPDMMIKKKASATANPNLQLDCNGEIQTPKISTYEQSREERIKENLQRMQKLGIMDLSHRLNSLLPAKRTRKNPSSTPYSSPLPPSGPIRRSSRLRNTAPVSYAEVGSEKKDKGVKLEEGTRPEVYTEEHEKLLGNTERSWTLFVDGYGKDGNRIYDPTKGKTCHQCRQKTLGHRTHCSKCNMVQGQFCGDCLYMRYGEHVLEAIENTNWVCPVCRGICNCSLCRNSKGWAPTGALYKKITQLGFKSVAHYLIQTRRAQTNVENNPENRDPVSAKRSLSFLDVEAQWEEPYNNFSSHLGISELQSEERDLDGINSEEENKMHTEPNPAAIHQGSVKKSNLEQEFQDGESAEIELKVKGHLGFSELDFEDNKDDNNHQRISRPQSEEIEKENKTHAEPNPAAIQQLSVRKSKLDGESVEIEFKTNDQLGFSELDFDNKRNDDFKGEHEESHLSYREHDSSNMPLGPGSDRKYDFHSREVTGMTEKGLDTKQAISNTLSLEEKKVHADNNSNVTSESHSKLKNRPLAAEPNVDSIAGRLRQRRKEVEDQNLPALNVKLSENELEKREELVHRDNQLGESSIGTENSLKRKNRLSLAAEPSADSIGGRLRQRRREGKDNDRRVLPEHESEKKEELVHGDNQKGESSIGTENGLKLKKRLSLAAEPSADSNGGRLRQSRREGEDNDIKVLPGTNKNTSDDKAVNNTLPEEAGGNLKHTSSGTDFDSIARRLRPRNSSM